MKLKLLIACILWLFVAVYTAHDVAKKREVKREEMTFEQLHKITE